LEIAFIIIIYYLLYIILLFGFRIENEKEVNENLKNNMRKGRYYLFFCKKRKKGKMKRMINKKEAILNNFYFL